MNAAWILLALALVFGMAALWKRGRQGRFDIAARVWLRVALVFAAIGLWLMWRQGIAL